MSGTRPPDALPDPPPCPALSADERRQIERIAESYERLTGRPLVCGADVVAALWRAPFAVLAHGSGADPVFFFGNATALGLFETDFAAFTRLPSRFSAEAMLRDERARLLDRVTRFGIIEDYAGVRISTTGRRFRIANAAVWNLADEAGHSCGQAAAFTQWEMLPP